VVDATNVGGEAADAPEADALITEQPGLPIAVQGADCAPIAFITNRGPIAVAHAGWRGLAAGVVGAVVDELHSTGATVEQAIVGPVIGSECYEFGAEDLDHVAGLLGDDVRATASNGNPALDMKSAIISSFSAAGVTNVHFVGGCTACADAGFSHRSRRDRERHALVAQIQPQASAAS